MKISILAAAAVAMAFATSAHAQQMSAEEFAAMAASSDMFEIGSSELAKEKSENTELTGFADMMITDHTKASEELKTAAESAGVEVPTEMMEMHATKLQELESMSGEEFDSAYIDAQVMAHEEALALMQGFAENGEDEALKAHAEKTAPVIEQHYEEAQQLQSAN